MGNPTHVSLCCLDAVCKNEEVKNSVFSLADDLKATPCSVGAHSHDQYVLVIEDLKVFEIGHSSNSILLSSV